MLVPVYAKQFAKDIKRIKKRGKNLEKFKIISQILLEGKALDPIHHDHKLIGSYHGRRECHIESDWLLIYKKERDCIIFEGSDTHSDLFR